jgi:hypothetical protein
MILAPLFILNDTRGAYDRAVGDPYSHIFTLSAYASVKSPSVPLPSPWHYTDDILRKMVGSRIRIPDRGSVS